MLSTPLYFLKTPYYTVTYRAAVALMSRPFGVSSTREPKQLYCVGSLFSQKIGKEGFVLAASAFAQADTGKTRLLETQSLLLDMAQASPPALRSRIYV